MYTIFVDMHVRVLVAWYCFWIVNDGPFYSSRPVVGWIIHMLSLNTRTPSQRGVGVVGVLVCVAGERDFLYPTEENNEARIGKTSNLIPLNQCQELYWYPTYQASNCVHLQYFLQ